MNVEYRVEWSAKAASDLGEHVAFQRQVSEIAAEGVLSKVLSAGDSLTLFPERFPEFSMPTNFPVVVRKCIVEGRYILLYGIQKDNVVKIYRVLDARRRFSGLLV